MIDNKRHLNAIWSTLAAFLAASLPLTAIIYALQILPEMGIVIYKEQFLVGFLTLSLVLTFILIRPVKNSSIQNNHSDENTPSIPQDGSETVPWYDLILIAAALGAGGYTTFWYHILLPQIGLLTLDKTIVSTVGVVLLLEAARRYTGWTMVIVGLVALTYAYFGHYIGGVFEVRVIRFDRLMIYNYMGQDAIHGPPMFVAATIVAGFMLFGQMLFAVGAGQAISDFGFALMGKRRGGAAKVSVVASALFGSLSGSASANVATTGMITIPMIKAAGYPAHKAGAIEAVASTGGLILPPIMAATGFIMAEFLGVPYADVATAALLPALLFYFCLFIQVDLEAAKNKMSGLSEDKLPVLRSALKAVTPVSIPVGVLLFTLFVLYRSPEISALFATVATILLSLALPGMRRTFTHYLNVLVSTGEAVVYVVIICAIAGLVMGCLGITGLGANLSQTLVDLAGGQVWLLLIFAALASIILGMGVPVTATYIILVMLVAPALIDLGISALATHMFIFYYGTLSFLTPPVCISVFVAAALAKAEMMKTALFSMRLAVVAYILPFFFIFNQGYLFQGSAVQISNVIAASIAGVFLVSVALVGYFVSSLSFFQRVLIVGVGLATLGFSVNSWLLTLVSWGSILGLYLLQNRKIKNT